MNTTATDNRTKLVVVNEHTLGYIQPETPNTVSVFRALTRKGAPYTTNTVYSIGISDRDNVRLANAKDFEEYRVCFEGYEKREDEYIFEK